VPIAQSQMLYQKLKSAGVAADFVVVKNAGHNFEPIGGDISPSQAEIGRMVGEFFDVHLKG
jgi:dipeptidyl aminopeptidase/acylaminoacyl peptidase